MDTELDGKFQACHDDLFAGDLPSALGLIAWMLREYEEVNKPKIRVSNSIAKVARELRSHPFASAIGGAVKSMLLEKKP